MDRLEHNTPPLRERQAALKGSRKKRFSSLSVLWVMRQEGFVKREKEEGELFQGTLDLLILKALARSPMHGYGVAEWIHDSSHDVLSVEEGALYPALHRLELRGLLSSKWGSSENNRRAKFYALTSAGRQHLARETESWRRISAAMARVLQTA
jgi:PadR family transcriptional regulator PadR